jgi:5-methylcytosine-specific restriction enzyme subunit McrC
VLYFATEHSLLTTGPAHNGNEETVLPEEAFEALKAYALRDDTEMLLRYFVQRGRPCLRVGACVGLLQANERVSIEILPKITAGLTSESIKTARMALLRMLQVVPELFPKILPDARLSQLAGLPLPDVLAALFLEKAGQVIHQGLQSSYEQIEDELPYVKGKLQPHRRPWTLLTHPNCLPVAYDKRTRQNAPNRLLKACLQQLKGGMYARQVRQYLFALDDVQEIHDWLQDLSVAKNHSRSFRAYVWLWPWAEWLLGGRAPGVSEGNIRLPGLLFPTQNLFESYIAESFKRHPLPGADVSIQESAHHLLYDPAGTPSHRLRPDVVIRRGDEVWVLDTKWKSIRGNERQVSQVSQSDLYQLYAYGQRYVGTKGKVKLGLIYPQTADFKTAPPPYAYEPHLPLYLLPANLHVPAPEMIGALWHLLDA